MIIRVRYSAQARLAAGVAAEDLVVPDGCCVTALLSSITSAHGSPLSELIHAGDGSVRPAILLAIDDDLVFAADDPVLRDGCVVSIISPIAGG